jgi:hypothetical protein
MNRYFVELRPIQLPGFDAAAPTTFARPDTTRF